MTAGSVEALVQLQIIIEREEGNLALVGHLDHSNKGPLAVGQEVYKVAELMKMLLTLVRFKTAFPLTQEGII